MDAYHQFTFVVSVDELGHFNPTFEHAEPHQGRVSQAALEKLCGSLSPGLSLAAAYEEVRDAVDTAAAEKLVARHVASEAPIELDVSDFHLVSGERTHVPKDPAGL